MYFRFSWTKPPVCTFHFTKPYITLIVKKNMSKTFFFWTIVQQFITNPFTWSGSLKHKSLCSRSGWFILRFISMLLMSSNSSSTFRETLFLVFFRLPLLAPLVPLESNALSVSLLLVPALPLELPKQTPFLQV